MWVLALAICSSACPPAGGRGVDLQHDAYVWQRLWTGAVQRAAVESSSRIRAWRVLAAEVNGPGRLDAAQPDLALLGRLGRPVVAVVRIDGSLPVWDPEPALRGTLEIMADWQAAGVPLAGLEVDHDCATSKLPEYALFLERLRRAMPRTVPLSITALPTWLESSELAGLLERVDESVLQVHAVSDPAGGLFDQARARDWIGEWSVQAPGPFRVALPTYGSRVTWDAAGRVIAVQSEAPLGAAGIAGLELFADPRSVAGLVEEIRRDPPAGFRGIAWFRLPTEADRRGWSRETWHAVMEGRRLETRVEVRAIPAAAPEVLDIRVFNTGEIDSPLPRTVRVIARGRCLADALAEYRLAPGHRGVEFELAGSGYLKAHRSRAIGWVRCPDQEVRVHALD